MSETVWIVGYCDSHGRHQIVEVHDTMEEAEIRLEEFCSNGIFSVMAGGWSECRERSAMNGVGHYVTFLDLADNPIAKYVRVKDAGVTT